MNKVLLVLFISLSTALFSQNKVEVTGQVKDAITKDALEFCSVSVQNPAKEIVSGTVTDQKGFFTISLNPGAYRFVYSFIGYVTDTSEMTMVGSNKFVGVINLVQDVNFISEVNIKTNSSENLLDRDVQIVTDKMKAGASNTKEVLEKVNGVTYDRYNNSIKVDNDSKVIILVDGLEKDQEYIKNLAPDRLKKIEVIRDPGGRYALEGYSSVINIILKKDYQGTEIFISERGMLDTDPQKKEYIPVQNGASATLNYVYNKVNIYGKYSSNFNNFNLISTNLKEYQNGFIIESVPEGDDINTRVKQLYNGITVGADYYINPKHTISMENNIMTQPYNINKTEENYSVNYLSNGSLVNHLNTLYKNQTGSKSYYSSLFYNGKINENNTFNSNFVFAQYADNYTNTYNENDVDIRTENGDNNRSSTKFYFEYNHTINSKSGIQFGYGNTWVQSNNTYTVETTTNNFEYSDIRNKLYSYYSLQFTKKLGMKLGCAAETSAPVADGRKNNYLIFQPYGDFKYKPNEKIDFKVKYRSASNYPGIGQSNPFTYMLDLQSVRTGNPYLTPEVTHKISMQTNILGGLLTIEPYYHFSNNYIAEIGTLRSDSIFEYNYANTGFYQNYGLEARMTIPFGKSIFLQSDFDFYKSSVTYSGNEYSLNDWSMSNQFIYVNQAHGTVVGIQYQNNLRKFITSQGYNKGDNDFWIAFIQQPFLKKQLTVMLLYFTPITWGVDFNQGSFIQTSGYSESKFNDIGFLKNMIMVEISYRFNKGKTVTKIEKNIELDTEKKTKGMF
ncbi:MAG: hypothetical protein CVU05_00350 [Bacteroidetes bacterium HGW-Bacteroidetes-21]|nr:MAG: hypothetical protein CVU05_00350 [Bacteroidetes bacterium HGW-Bacteroidetes-21]